MVVKNSITMALRTCCVTHEQKVVIILNGQSLLTFAILLFSKKTDVCWWVVVQPEMYRNPLFVAALDSVTSRLLTTGQASEKFGIRESALIAAVSWCDADQPCDAVPTSSAVTRSTSSLQVGSCFL